MIRRIFAWLRARWQRRERAIFAYWDGRALRRVDPLLAWYSMLDDPQFNLDRHPAGVDRGERESIEITAGMVRRVFRVLPLNQQGLTEQECLQLFLDFMAYWAGLKKSISGSRTSSSHSAPMQPAPSTTRPDAELPSTSTAPSFGNPLG